MKISGGPPFLFCGEGEDNDMSERQDRKRLVGTFVSPELAEQVKHEAARREQTVAGFLRRLIRRELELR